MPKRRSVIARNVAGVCHVWVAAAALGQSVVERPVPPRGRVVPLAAIAVQRIGGNLLAPVGPWVPLTGGVDTPTTAAFDAYEGNVQGVPTGFCTSGCNQFGWCPSSSPSHRWMNANYRAPLSTNDMTVAPGLGGADAIRVQFAWWWAHAEPTRCLVGVFTGVDFHDCPSGTPPTWGELGGIIFDYGSIPGEGGYWFSDIDLRGSGLALHLPPTGSGTHSILIGTDFTGGTFTFDSAWGTQPMQWGTGDAESPPDGRPGSQGPMQWDDWRNASGALEWNECAYYNDVRHCPSPAGAMLAFFVAPQDSCSFNCDGSTHVPVLNANDFQCFLNHFAAGHAYANCDASTLAPTLNANDFLCFLNGFAAGCD